MKIIVKGDLKAALDAAYQRGIAVQSYIPLNNGRETLLECSDQDESSVQAWFCEPIEAKPGIGFPIGACLYYTKHSHSAKPIA